MVILGILLGNIDLVMEIFVTMWQINFKFTVFDYLILTSEVWTQDMCATHHLMVDTCAKLFPNETVEIL